MASTIRPLQDGDVPQVADLLHTCFGEMERWDEERVRDLMGQYRVPAPAGGLERTRARRTVGTDDHHALHPSRGGDMVRALGDPGIHDSMAEAWHDGSSRPDWTLVAEDDGRPIARAALIAEPMGGGVTSLEGVAAFLWVDFEHPGHAEAYETWTIVHIGVVSNHRGHGHLSQLLAAADRVARERGFASGLSDVDIENGPMVAAMIRAGHRSELRPWHVWHYRREVVSPIEVPGAAAAAPGLLTAVPMIELRGAMLAGLAPGPPPMHQLVSCHSTPHTCGA